ncbi:TetR/AcrR family transcriptional regulator [Zobellia russellii]|uniref:TetR/AcrR family transcriptional regulator n=1 Tax=Zobellia russellii TaxID=248907 RepID=UPI0037DD6BA6
MGKETVKDKILLTACELFYKDGYNQTGINKILKVAEVSKDSMYRHFKSKEAIAVAYLERQHKMVMSLLKSNMDKEEPGADAVLSMFDFLIDWLKESGYRGCGFQNIFTDIPKDQNSIKEMVYMNKNEIRQLVYNELNKAEPNEMDIKELSDEILVLWEGAIILSQIQKNNWPILAGRKACEKLLNR